jgi:hypothetical protein
MTVNGAKQSKLKVKISHHFVDTMDGNFPIDFPPLPDHSSIASGWPANVQEAHRILHDVFHRALTLLRQEGGDPLRLSHASEQLTNDSVRMLERMEESGVSPGFTQQCANAIGPLVFELEVAALAAEGVYV